MSATQLFVKDSFMQRNLRRLKQVAGKVLNRYQLTFTYEIVPLRTNFNYLPNCKSI